MVVSVGDDVLSDSVDRHSRKAIKFPLAVSVLSKFLDKLAVCVENLDAVIGRVRHDDGVVRAYGDAARPSK